MADVILTPAQVEAFRRCQGHCARARQKLMFLRSIGLPAEEEEARVEHLDQIAKTALELHDQSVDDKRKGR